MSHFLTAAATLQTLTLTAMEEASRDQRREADFEHLFLALTLNEQRAGAILRDAGITLDVAREAVRAQHSEQLRALGIDTAPPGGERIVFHETEGYQWTDRALRIANFATDKKRGDGADGVLRGLLDEPSGMIAALLERLGTDADSVRERLDAAVERPALPVAGPGAGRRSYQTFVPASVQDVWELVSPHARMPEWNPYIASIEPPATDNDIWIARARTERDNGKPIKIKDDMLHREVERLDAQEPHRVTWRLRFRDAKEPSPQTLTIELAASGTGCQVTLTSTRRQAQGWRLVVGAPLSPIRRLLSWLDLFSTANQISRVFR